MHHKLSIILLLRGAFMTADTKRNLKQLQDTLGEITDITVQLTKQNSKKAVELVKNLPNTEYGKKVSQTVGDISSSMQNYVQERKAEKERQERLEQIHREEQMLDEIQESIRRTELVFADNPVLKTDPIKSLSDEANNAAAVQTETQAQEAAQTDAQEEPQEKKDALQELDNLVGLSTIKEDVKELTAFIQVQKSRQDKGLKSVPVSLHLVFTGNPGTGKTTVARIIAQAYKQIGVLSKGQLVETDRAGLVAGYVGQTALKTQKMIEKAMGGVLFIDEAYSLSQKDDAFGQEAIDTILKAMEDHRDDFVVIVAGYTDPMTKFIESNPGLKSRFNKYIEFADYTNEDLQTIFKLNCDKYDYKLEDGVEEQVAKIIQQRREESQDNFANAREVRNLFEEIITNQAARISRENENLSQANLTLITLADIPTPNNDQS